MEYLPAPVQRWLEGPIDPHSQHLVETYAQYVYIALVMLGFVASFLTKSVLIGLEVFLAGFIMLLLAVVPPWPYLNSHPIKFRPFRGPTFK